MQIEFGFYFRKQIWSTWSTGVITLPFLKNSVKTWAARKQLKKTIMRTNEIFHSSRPKVKELWFLFTSIFLLLLYIDLEVNLHRIGNKSTKRVKTLSFLLKYSKSQIAILKCLKMERLGETRFCQNYANQYSDKTYSSLKVFSEDSSHLN